MKNYVRLGGAIITILTLLLFVGCSGDTEAGAGTADAPASPPQALEQAPEDNESPENASNENEPAHDEDSSAKILIAYFSHTGNTENMANLIHASIGGDLFPNDLYEYTLVAFAVKFPVKYLLPRPEIELAVRNGDDNLAPHDRAFHMSVGVVLIAVVVILVVRFFRREFLKPTLKVAVQTALIVIDKHTRRDVHGVYKAQALSDSALGERGFDLWRDIDVSAPGPGIAMQFFAVMFHMRSLP